LLVHIGGPSSNQATTLESQMVHLIQGLFGQTLRADGYTEIETQDLQPRPAKGEHGHPFSIRGLVLAGTFIVTQDDQRTVFGPGQVFAVDHEHPHDESIGPEGARVLVGRKYAKE